MEILDYRTTRDGYDVDLVFENRPTSTIAVEDEDFMEFIDDYYGCERSDSAKELEYKEDELLSKYLIYKYESPKAVDLETASLKVKLAAKLWLKAKAEGNELKATVAEVSYKVYKEQYENIKAGLYEDIRAAQEVS